MPEDRAGLPWRMHPEAALVEGCPAAPLLPRGALRGLRASVSALDGSPRSVAAAEEAMEDALWAAQPPATCAAAGAKKR